MSKINPLYEKGDVKFFYNEHLKRMRVMGKKPISYTAFYRRLRNGMRLRDAIYTPSNTNMIRYNMKPTSRAKKLKKKLTSIRARFISLFH